MTLTAAATEPQHGWARIVALLIAVAVFTIGIHAREWWDKIKNPSPGRGSDSDSDEDSLVEGDDDSEGGVDQEGDVDLGDHAGFSVRYDQNGKRYLVARYKK